MIRESGGPMTARLALPWIWPSTELSFLTSLTSIVPLHSTRSYEATHSGRFLPTGGESTRACQTEWDRARLPRRRSFRGVHGERCSGRGGCGNRTSRAVLSNLVHERDTFVHLW